MEVSLYSVKHTVRVKALFSLPIPAHAWLLISAAETCNKFLKIEHHDSIMYSKHELILTFIASKLFGTQLWT